ncbi:MAG: 16S rRNA (guanine(527)-N(7))-methyltransferase RsmG [Rubrivivax sp.]
MSPSAAGFGDRAEAFGSLQGVARALGLDPGEERIAMLVDYVDLLERWNAAYNLTALRERGAVLGRHLADCLAVVPALARHAARGRLLDVGSGAGLPGVVIAAMLPDWDVTCVDAVGKKAAFVRQVAGALRLANLHAEHARIEALRAPPFDVVTARAFGSLAEFVRLTGRHLAPHGVWLAMKGHEPVAEMAALPAEIDVFHVEPLLVPGLAAQRCIVWMRRKEGG